MKKIIFILFPLVIAVLICGCASAPIFTWDNSLPESETVTIHWMANQVEIVAYNGINVDWKMKTHGFFTLNTIVIPAGVTKFELKGKQYDKVYYGNIVETTVYDWDGIIFTFNFEKGKEYTVSPLYVWGGINIYNGKSVKQEDLIEKIRIEWKSEK